MLEFKIYVGRGDDRCEVRLDALSTSDARAKLKHLAELLGGSIYEASAILIKEVS